jgi:hypothetical protein
MVALTTFLPPSQSFDTLARLRGVVGVLRPANTIGGLTRLFLKADSDVSVSLSVDYRDVVFKFECFNMVVDESLPSSFATAHQIAVVSGWDTVKCIFPFEWRRSAVPGEVPVDREQITRERGERKDISSTASAVCVSMVGIAFWNTIRDQPIAAIVSDDDNVPGTLRICEKSEEITAAIDGAELVSADEAQRWVSQLEQLRHALVQN